MAYVTLISSDELTFSLPREAAELSRVIVEKLANNGNEVVIENHNSNTVRHVVHFLSQVILGDENSKERMKRRFMYGKATRLGELFETALAAHDLEIQVLEDLMIERIAHKIEGRSKESVRDAFKDNDLTEEQRAFTKARYRWAFEDVEVEVEPAPVPANEGVERDVAQVTAEEPEKGSASVSASHPSDVDVAQVTAEAPEKGSASQPSDVDVAQVTAEKPEKGTVLGSAPTPSE